MTMQLIEATLARLAVLGLLRFVPAAAAEKE
jgi:hypothetical protein